MEVKLLFGEHIWDAAQHADALGKRTFELRLRLQHSVRPADKYVEHASHRDHSRSLVARASPVSPRPRLQVEQLPRPPRTLSMTSPGERVVVLAARLGGAVERGRRGSRAGFPAARPTVRGTTAR